jgi:hypothetical protein
MNSLTDKIMEENDMLANEYYTPQTIAWKLLMDDTDEALSGALLGFGDGEDDDPESFMFEILITIFIEMVFDIAVVAQASNDGSTSQDFEFNPDMEKFDLDLFIDTIKKKFNRISYICSVTTYDKKSMSSYELNELQKTVNNRYCRIILKHNPDDKKTFRKKQIDENYHMILNENYRIKKHLKDIYAIVIINEKVYQIYFDKV